jgi:hypothetical protein
VTVSFPNPAAPKQVRGTGFVPAIRTGRTFQKGSGASSRSVFIHPRQFLFSMSLECSLTSGADLLSVFLQTFQDRNII